MNSFAFRLLQAVYLTLSGESGHVIGRAEYSHGTAQYYVRYLSADGRQCEGWFGDDALVSNEAQLPENDFL